MHAMMIYTLWRRQRRKLGLPKIPLVYRAILAAALCLGGAVTAVNFFSGGSFTGGGLSFATGVKLLVPGELRLALPPLGTASAHTHGAPVRLELELRGLNVSILRDLGSDPGVKDRVLADSIVYAKRAMTQTALFAVLLAGLGGFSVMLLLRGRRWIHYGAAFFLPSLFCAGLLVWTLASFNQNALKQPKYEGMLESAPWVMSVLSGSLEGLNELGEGFATMAKNLPRLSLSGQIGSPMSDIDEDLLVMHVSDIHNNSAAFALMHSLVQSFPIDFIIDTGDLTDYGSSLEGDLARRVKELGVPYVFVPGNHDSPAVAAQLRACRNVQIADGRIITINGLRLLGVADPAASDGYTAVADAGELRAAGEQLLRVWRSAKVKPDLVATHNPVILRPLYGLAPVVMNGHDHRASLQWRQGTLIEDVGTSGAAGLRGLASDKSPPYTVDLQYWRRDADKHLLLIAVDTITIDGLSGSLHISRTAINGPKPLIDAKAISPINGAKPHTR